MPVHTIPAAPAGAVAGFCAVAARGRRTVLESLYIADGQPPQLAGELVAAAVDRFGGRADLHAVVTLAHAPAYREAGFTDTTSTAQFVRLVRKVPA
jgi:hypothetical protein